MTEKLLLHIGPLVVNVSTFWLNTLFSVAMWIRLALG